MDRIEQHIHDTVNDIDREANMENYGRSLEEICELGPEMEAIAQLHDDMLEKGELDHIYNPAYDTSNMTPEEKEKFEKDMSEYEDFHVPDGAECRADCFD